jgi:hypothetical protein
MLVFLLPCDVPRREKEKKERGVFGLAVAGFNWHSIRPQSQKGTILQLDPIRYLQIANTPLKFKVSMHKINKGTKNEPQRIFFYTVKIIINFIITSRKYLLFI